MLRVWTERILPADISAAFDGLAELIGPATETPDDPFSAVPQANALIAAGGVFGPEVLDRAPKALVVSRTGIGYDKVDVMNWTYGAKARLGLAYHLKPGVWLFGEWQYRWIGTSHRELRIPDGETLGGLPWAPYAAKGTAFRLGIGW